MGTLELYPMPSKIAVNQDETIVLGDENLLVEVYGRLQRQSWSRWRAKVPDLLNLLDDSIPVRSAIVVSFCFFFSFICLFCLVFC